MERLSPVFAYPKEFDASITKILDTIAKIPESHEKRSVFNNCITSITYSVYENLLLQFSCLYNIRPHIMQNLFYYSKFCEQRTAKSISDHYNRTRHKTDMIDINLIIKYLRLASLSEEEVKELNNYFINMCKIVANLNEKCISAKLYLNNLKENNIILSEKLDVAKKLDIPELSDTDDSNTIFVDNEIKISNKITEVTDSFDTNLSIYRFLNIAKNNCCRFEIFASIWNCSVDKAKEVITNFRDVRGIPIIIEPNGQTFRIVSSKDNDDYTANKIIKITAPVEILNNGIECTKLGIISDTHYGSDECDDESIEKFYHIATSLGVRVFTHSGDWVDGVSVYRGQRYSLSNVGFEKQIHYVSKYYPYYEDVNTYGITGNHDDDFMKASGSNPLKLLSMLRQDIHYVGNYQAYLDINGFIINLHHPGGSCSRSKPENTLRSIVELKNQHMRQRNISNIDLCVVGHFHTKAFIETQSVKLAMFGGGFQKSTGLVKQFGLIPFEGGFIVSMYKMPDGSHKLEPHTISFNVY